MQIGCTGAGRMFSSDVTITNGITVFSGRATGTAVDVPTHELVIPASKTLTIQSGATANMDLGFRQDQNDYGGVLQLGSTVLNSGASPATLRFLRSDPLAVPGTHTFRSIVMAGNITGTGANAVLDLQADTHDGGYSTIDNITTGGGSLVVTTTLNHTFAAGDTVFLGHNEDGTLGGANPGMFAGTAGDFVVASVTANTLTITSALGSSSTNFTTTKPVVGIVGAGFASTSNLIVNGGMTVQGTAKRIQNLLSTTHLNGVTGSGGFLAPKPSDVAAVLAANTTTWPNQITLQVQHTTAGTDIMLGGTFANNIAVGATSVETAATLDGGSQTVTSSTGSVNVRGFGILAGSLLVGGNASVWPGSTTSTLALNANEILQGTGTVDLTNSGKFKTIISNPAAPFKQQLNGGAVLIGSNSILSLAVQSGNYASVDIPIIVCTSASITAPFSPGNILNLPSGWQVIYEAAGTPVDPTVTPADSVVVRTNSNNVTPVTIGDFAAGSEGAGVLVSWNAFSEFKNAGFNLYRCALGSSDWTRVNAALIAGRITNPELKASRLYDWAAPGVYHYKLESVSIASERETYAECAGPVTVDGVANAATDDGEAAALASLFAADNAVRTRELSAAFVPADGADENPIAGDGARVARAESIVSKPDGSLLMPASVRALAVAADATGASVASGPVEAPRAAPQFAAPAVSARFFTSSNPGTARSYSAAKVVYSAPGVLKIPQAMLPAGFDIRHSVVQREGLTLVPLALTADALVVFGAGYQDDYTDKDALFVRSINTQTAAGIESHAQGLFDGTVSVNESTPASVTADYLDVYFDYNYRPYTFAPWFSNQYLTGGTTQTFSLETPFASGGTATLTVNLWSLTDSGTGAPDHALQVLVNGQPAGQAVWSGGGKLLQLTFQVDAGVLIAGANSIDLVTPELDGVDPQIAFLHSLTMAYTRQLDGSQPVTITNASGAASMYELSNVPGANAWVVDTRFPDRAALVPYQTQVQADGTYRLRFSGSAGGSGTYLVVPVGQENLPIAVEKRLVKPVNSSSTYLAVGPSQFSAGVQPLLAKRQKEGLRGSFVDQEQIFDYYNSGRYGPAGIQNAVRSARPQYLLLLGRTNYDYLNYSGLNVDPLCPAFLVPTSFWAQSTSDSMFGDLGRGYPEVAVGRIPVENTADLSVAVQHILGYAGAPVSGVRVHAVADQTDPSVANFPAQAAAMSQSLPDLAWQPDYLGVTYQTSAEVNAAMTSAANGGADWLVYVGHGNASRLGKTVPRILDVAGIQAWTGNTVMLQSTCTANWAAADQAGLKTIAIQGLTQPQGGISASIASSTYMNSDMGVAFMTQLMATASGGGKSQRWGQALLKAQQWAAQQGGGFYTDLMNTESIFGDPAMPIYMPNPAPANKSAPSGTGGGSNGSVQSGQFWANCTAAPYRLVSRGLGEFSMPQDIELIVDPSAAGTPRGRDGIRCNSQRLADGGGRNGSPSRGRRLPATVRVSST